MTGETQTSRHLYGAKPQGSGIPDLSLLVSPGVFMYALFDGNVPREICQASLMKAPGNTMADKLQYLVNNHQLLRQRYNKVNIAILNQQFAVIPEAYYSAGDAKTILEFASGMSGVKNVLQHRVKNIRFCYTADPEVLAFLERSFSNASIRHAGAASICLLFSHHTLASADVFINISEGLLELAVQQKGELAFYNVFNVDTDEDILYYLLFTLEELALDPATVRLAVAADREVTDTLMQNIRNYVRQVNFCAVDPAIRLTGELSAMPHHYYFSLIHQHLCEL